MSQPKMWIFDIIRLDPKREVIVGIPHISVNVERLLSPRWERDKAHVRRHDNPIVDNSSDFGIECSKRFYEAW